MIKLLIWLAGDFAILYAIDRLGLWHEIVAGCVLGCAVLWLLGGAFVLGRARSHSGLPREGRTPLPTHMREAIERAQRERAEREGIKT